MPETTGKIDTQSRQDPGAPYFLAGEGPAFSARVAGERNGVPGQELTGEEERAHADLGVKSKERELGVWDQCKVHSAAQMGTRAEDVVDTHCVLARAQTYDMATWILRAV